MKDHGKKADWIPLEGCKPSIVTPELIVIERNEINKDFYSILEAMKTSFKANVLILGKYSDEERIPRTGFKDALRGNGIWTFLLDNL